MKRIGLFLFALLIGNIANAHTIDWYVDGSVYDTTSCEVGNTVTPPTAPTRYGYTFREWVFYTPIEYLEATGTQYIDTGYIPSYAKTKIETELSPLRNSNVSGSLFGCGNGANKNRFFLQNENSKYSIGLGTTYQISSVSIGKKSVVFEPNGQNSYKVNIDSTEYTYNINSANPPTSNIRLFDSVLVRIYYLKIYDNGTLVRDFIPVLDESGTPCMFDKVSHQFFYNAGTGDFIAGPVISGGGE